MNKQYVYHINSATPVHCTTMKKDHSGSRLRTAMQAMGMTAREFASALSISPQTLNNWFGRGLPGRYLLPASKVLKVNPEWLESGEGLPRNEGLNEEDYENLQGMSPAQLDEWRRRENIGRTRRSTYSYSYPEISWDLAGGPLAERELTDYEDRLRHTSDADAGSNAFWLSVRDSSMTSPSGITFPEGYLILVSPDVTPRAGQYVLVRITELNEATFKQLVIDAGDWYLKPLNPDFPMKVYKDGWEMIGTIVDAKIPRHVLTPESLKWS
ncbi:LexA family transcriptional regulator [Pseudomonas putida]|uniref:LexA family transcriptional regulator n=1 Tax=Pseudomonas putida TaxID=303 RepID=UPI0020230D41|nr:XRE family transcriptional regulator [Pseudomonas putida]MCL8308147.1 XRE family transcriptional regulator [Pseudomonas putida]